MFMLLIMNNNRIVSHSSHLRTVFTGPIIFNNKFIYRVLDESLVITMVVTILMLDLTNIFSQWKD